MCVITTYKLTYNRKIQVRVHEQVACRRQTIAGVKPAILLGTKRSSPDLINATIHLVYPQRGNTPAPPGARHPAPVTECRHSRYFKLQTILHGADTNETIVGRVHATAGLDNV